MLSTLKGRKTTADIHFQRKTLKILVKFTIPIIEEIITLKGDYYETF